jgi:hypothetical protein
MRQMASGNSNEAWTSLRRSLEVPAVHIGPRFSPKVRAMRIISILLTLLLSSAPAFADTILLKNGRSITGQVVAMNKQRVSIRIPGGMIQFNRNLVQEITRLSTPAEQIAQRLIKIKNNPAALERLSLQAKAQGLPRQARDIKQLAKGLRLEKKLEALNNSKDPSKYLNLLRWTQLNSYSLTVQKFVVGKALRLDPNHGLARLALKRLEQEEAKAKQGAEKSRLKEKNRRKRDREKRTRSRTARPIKSAVRRDSQSPENINRQSQQVKKDLEELKRLRALLDRERKALEQEQLKLERIQQQRRGVVRRARRGRNVRRAQGRP